MSLKIRVESNQDRRLGEGRNSKGSLSLGIEIKWGVAGEEREEGAEASSGRAPLATLSGMNLIVKTFKGA